MPTSLRVHFGPLAGSLAHAAALLTLARVADMDGEVEDTPPLDTSLQANEQEQALRLAAMLAELVARTGVTAGELRAEGFPEQVVQDALAATPRARTAHRTPLLPRYDAALRILQEVLH